MNTTITKIFKMIYNQEIKWVGDLYSFISGLFALMLGYFYPMRNMVHLMLLLFLIDVLIGYWAAKKVRGEKFNVKLIWNHTCPRILITMLIIIILYLWDDVSGQTYLDTYNYFAMFIGGVLIYSIFENAHAITKWEALNVAKLIIWKKFKREDLDLDDIKSMNNVNDKTK